MSEDRSYGKYLRDQNKINDEFEAILSHLTLEEIIVLKRLMIYLKLFLMVLSY